MERHVHFGWGYGPGLLDFLWDVDLLGKRVAYYLDSENNCGWNAINDIQYKRSHAGLREKYGDRDWDEIAATWLRFDPNFKND